jgi:hypothetical protein
MEKFAVNVLNSQILTDAALLKRQLQEIEALRKKLKVFFSQVCIILGIVINSVGE